LAEKYCLLFSILSENNEIRPMLPMHPRSTIKVPANPNTTWAGGADQDGHPGRVKARGAAGELKKGWRQESIHSRHPVSHS